jgi:preprotein translocase subunit SecD
MAKFMGALGRMSSMLWSPSARNRSIRLSILIIIVISVALASLAWRNVNIDFPGDSDLKRGGSGPLGLKLGLDLRGGGHLVYQTDTGTRFDVTFAEPTSAADIAQALQEARFGEEELAIEGFSILPRSPTSVQVRTPVLSEDDPRILEFQDTLSSVLGAITEVRVDVIGEPTPEQMEGVLDKINRRVNLFGTEEPIIQQFGEDRIIVQLPGASGSVTEVQFVEPVPEAADTETLRSTLAASGYDDLKVDRQDEHSFRVQSATVGAEIRQRAQAAVVESLGAVARFNVTSGIDDAKALIGPTARLEFMERTCEGGVDQETGVCLSPADTDIGLSGDDLTRAFVAADANTGAWAVNVHFNSRGAEIFSDLTRRIVGQDDRRIAIFLDDALLIDVVAKAWIRNGQSQITGRFTRERARTIAIQLESGRLPVPLRLIQENDVDALLGSESLRNSLIAGLVGLGLVMAFMIAYYRMAGVVASLALLFYAVVVLAIFKLIPITLTLSHIGGFILSVGMAVDANVLIFERMKEEVRIGRTLASSMEVGFNRAWPAIRDSNVSTIITCLVLLWFGDRLGGGLVTGFALSLLIGVAASMFTAVIVSRNLLQLLAWIGLGHRINLFTPEGAQRPAPTSGGGA